jgi:hypothetical protein
MMYPQDFEEEPTAWYLKKPSSRKIASRIDQWERGNVTAAAIILSDPEASGLALEWAKMVAGRKPYEFDSAIKAERAKPQPVPTRRYSGDLPKLRDKHAPDPAQAMDSFLAHAPRGSRGL